MKVSIVTRYGGAPHNEIQFSKLGGKKTYIYWIGGFAPIILSHILLLFHVEHIEVFLMAIIWAQACAYGSAIEDHMDLPDWKHYMENLIARLRYSHDIIHETESMVYGDRPFRVKENVLLRKREIGGPATVQSINDDRTITVKLDGYNPYYNIVVAKPEELEHIYDNGLLNS